MEDLRGYFGGAVTEMKRWEWTCQQRADHRSSIINSEPEFYVYSILFPKKIAHY